MLGLHVPNLCPQLFFSHKQPLIAALLCARLQVFALYLSTYITIAISLDRCVAILDPMRRQGATQRVRIMMVLAWGCSALFSIPQVSAERESVGRLVVMVVVVVVVAGTMVTGSWMRKKSYTGGGDSLYGVRLCLSVCMHAYVCCTCA